MGEGRGLRIWPAAGSAPTTGPAGPLIQLAEFRFHAPLRYKPGIPVHIPEVRLDGLDIHLPPKSHSLHMRSRGRMARINPMARTLSLFAWTRLSAPMPNWSMNPTRPESFL